VVRTCAAGVSSDRAVAMIASAASLYSFGETGRIRFSAPLDSATVTA
jgi:hypothetical protein